MKGKTPRGTTYRHSKAKKILAESGGYARGGATDEPDDCPTPSNPKCKKAGGAVTKKRLDKPRRYASGGGVDGDDSPKKKSSAKTQVNIVIAGKDGASAGPALPPPMMPPAAMPPAPMPPAGGPPMGMPPGAGPMPPMHKRGGAVKEYPIDAGAGGGKGRLEKAAAYKSHRPKKGSGK